MGTRSRGMKQAIKTSVGTRIPGTSSTLQTVLRKKLQLSIKSHPKAIRQLVHPSTACIVCWNQYCLLVREGNNHGCAVKFKGRLEVVLQTHRPR